MSVKKNSLQMRDQRCSSKSVARGFHGWGFRHEFFKTSETAPKSEPLSLTDKCNRAQMHRSTIETGGIVSQTAPKGVCGLPLICGLLAGKGETEKRVNIATKQREKVQQNSIIG